MAGVSPAAVTFAASKSLAAAVVGGRIDASHPDAIAYVQKHNPGQRVPTVETVPRGHAARNAAKKTSGGGNPNPSAIPENIQEMADLTLREVTDRYGTDIALCDYLKAVKQIEDIAEKRMKTAALRGELVSRHAVEIGMVSPVSLAFKKLLSDGARTIARRMSAMVQGGSTVEECEAYVSDQIGAHIRPAKATMTRTLKGLERAGAVNYLWAIA